MLHVQLIMNGNTANLPALRPGDHLLSFADHLETGDVIVFLECREDDRGARIGLSRLGRHLQQGELRRIQSFEYVIERAIGPGETYERPLQTSYGPATLRLRHEVGV